MKKILVANRGEIACRVFKTARSMGIETVGLYTDEEVNLPHSDMADYNVNLGTGNLSDTYLNIKKIIDICLNHKVDAVHPGYGFLSENALFAEALENKGIKLIGPPREAMEAMGDKKTSKIMMEQMGVPLIPGYHGENQDPDLLLKEATTIGFPILVKASAGGGGKGMRIVEKESDFSSALEAAKREAQNAFGNDIVLIEKYITNPRHIEVQIISDGQNNHFHLFDRECSIQRRYQKIIEETPSLALSVETRKNMCEMGVMIAKNMKYEGAGTIEYILDEDGEFYFLEMNTRLQVEHPITEMVTGKDLVRLQIEAAMGKAFSFTQKDLKQNGHSIEVRIYAEDPDNDFLPTIGKLNYIGESDLRDIRLDIGYQNGNDIGISFDPMLAKLVVWSDSREEAIFKMKLALDDYPFLGMKTNRSYLKRILDHKEFLEGRTYTHFVKTFKEDLLPKIKDEEQKAKAIALFLTSMKLKIPAKQNNSELQSCWDICQGMRTV